MSAQVAVYLFALIPLLAVLIAVPFAWGWGLSWTDIGIGAFFYVLTGLGVTVGFHRYFTHGSLQGQAAAAEVPGRSPARWPCRGR